ncbi:MAG: hypothetical protein ACE5HB_01530 [Terriglobia bacterium]
MKAIVSFAVGLIVGFGVGYLVLARAPERAGALELGPAKDRIAKFELEGGQLVDEHPPFVVLVDRGDQMVWTSDGVKEFDVSIAPVPPERQDPNEFCSSLPPSPFRNDKTSWSTSSGRIVTGPAKREVVGCTYKFSISTPGGVTLDPHVIFDRAGR